VLVKNRLTPFLLVDKYNNRVYNTRMNKKRNKLERKLDEYNHTMELIRTIVPLIVLGLQVYIILKLI
jgi:hypothetical protein